MVIRDFIAKIGSRGEKNITRTECEEAKESWR